VRARDYSRKFDAYAPFFAAMEEAAFTYKRLLVVTAGQEAERRIARAALDAEASGALGMATYLTTVDRLEAAGALRSIWRRPADHGRRVWWQ
jgi:hypothetical protein